MAASTANGLKRLRSLILGSVSPKIIEKMITALTARSQIQYFKARCAQLMFARRLVRALRALMKLNVSHASMDKAPVMTLGLKNNAEAAG